MYAGIYHDLFKYFFKCCSTRYNTESIVTEQHVIVMGDLEEIVPGELVAP